MTSPVGGKPQSTQDKYDDIHSKGSTFGSELTEAKIRDIFSVQVKSPFLQALQELDKFALSVIIEIADAIGGVFTHDGQRSKPIYDAIIAQMGPVKTQVNTLGQHLQELSTEVTERIDTQEALLEETQGHIDDMSTILDEQKTTLAKNQEDLDAARQETSTAIAQSGEAVSLAKSYNETLNQRITTEFNKAVNQASAAVDQASALAQQLAEYKQQQQAAIDEAVGKAEQAVADLATLSPKVTDAVDKAGKASSDVTALTTRVSTAEGKVATAEQNVAALTPKVTDAVTKSDKAVADVAALNPKVTAASNKATQAASDVADLTPKVTAAQDKADKAASDLTTLTPKVTAAQSRADAAYTEAGKVRTDLTPKITAAQSKADTAVADLTKLEPKVTAAQSRADSAYTEAGKVRTEVTPKIEAAQTKGESALAVADTAVDWLKNPTEIGTSVIAVDPETKRPYYANHLDLVDDNPPGTSGPTYMSPASMTSRVSYGPTVPVDPKIKYTISFWAKASVAGSIIYGQFESQEGTNYSPEGKSMVVGAVSVSKPPQPSNRGENGEYVHLNTPRSYFIDRLELSTEWTYYEHEIQFAEGVTAVRISAMFWSHNRGVPADQYISGLDIRPQIPTQASVDKAQNDAIKANTDILRQQQEINAAQATANLAQKNFNDNQQKWNTASSNATKALQDSAALQGLLNDAQADINAHQKIFNDNQTKWNTASTNAIKALADAAKAQSDVNAEQAKFNTFQTQFNKDQTKWNTASTNATKALQDSTSALSKIATEQGKLNALQSDFNTKQTDWNNAVTRSLNTQKTVNDNFSKWTTGATTAIEANTMAIQALNAPQMGTSVIPLMPGTKTPAWTANADGTGTNPTYIKDGDPRWFKFDATRTPGSDNMVAVDSTLEYDFSVWLFGTTGSKLYVELRDQDGNHAVKSGGIRSYTDNNGAMYLIDNMTLENTWRKVSTTITLNPGVKFIKIGSIYGSHPNGVQGPAHLADMKMVPHVPTQKSVDDAQNAAIDANTEAVKALGKKSLGASLVPYKTPSTQEVKDYSAGKLNYDPWADPEYLDAGHVIASPARGRVARANAGHSSKGFNGSYVSVDSSIWYKVKFQTYASTSGSHLYIYMADQDGNLALAETPFADKGRVAGGLVHGLTLPSGIKEWSGLVKFKAGTTSVKLGTFFWNHANGSTTGVQEFGGLEIVPDVPTQDDLNLSFNNNFARIDDELKLVKSTDASFKADQTKWNTASTNATKALQNFQKQQTEMNNLFQEQLWAQLDMIEQLDIQTPRVFHRKTTEGAFQKAPDWTTWTDCRYHDSPFLLHLSRYEDTRKMYWVAKGRWEGKLKVTTNWTNGATDVMVYDITRTDASAMATRDESIKLAKKARAYAEEGGAWGTNLRNSTFEIYPTHLGRTVGIRNPDSSGWYIDQSVMETGGPSMVRHQTADEIRFTNSFYSTLAFYARDIKGNKILVNANQVVEPMMIRRADLRVGTTYTFHEKPFITNTW